MYQTARIREVPLYRRHGYQASCMHYNMHGAYKILCNPELNFAIYLRHLVLYA